MKAAVQPSRGSAIGAQLLQTAVGLGCWIAFATHSAAQETAPGASPPSVAEAISREVQTLFQKCRSSVVRIEATDVHGRLSGSGFFIDPNGTVYTSYSVGGASWDVVVCHGERKYPARRLVADPRSGVAILKVEAETPFLMLGKSRGLPLAAPVLAIGYPMALPLTPDFGMIGGFDVRFQESYFATRHIRASVPVQRGESGAPLLNMQGEVIGILVASIGSSASFALPIEAAEKVRRDYMRFGDVRPGWIGIEIEPAAAPVEGSTAQVHDLLAEAPGEKAGLAKGDVLLQIGELPIASPEDVRDASFFITAGDALPVKVARAGTTHEFTVHAAEHPSNRAPERRMLLPALGVTEFPEARSLQATP